MSACSNKLRDELQAILAANLKVTGIVTEPCGKRTILTAPLSTPVIADELELAREKRNARKGKALAPGL